MASTAPRTQTDIAHNTPAMPFMPTALDLRWFAHIARHGPQSSDFLIELTRDTHRCRNTALRRFQHLRNLGFLTLPSHQRAMAKADFNPFVYDLGPKQRPAFKHWGITQSLARPTGHWWHGFMVSSVTSGIEICASRAGHTYISGDQILGIKNAPLGVPVGRHVVVPDLLFALRTTEGFRSYILEVDRGTEPVQSGAARKSLKSSVERCTQILRLQLHKSHYGLKSNLVVLWVFTSPARQERFLDLVGQYAGDQKSGILTQVIEGGFPRWQGVEAGVRGVWSARSGRALILV